MHRRLKVLMDAFAVARYTKRARVGQRTNGTLLAFRRHLKHRQPQGKARRIELCIALVTELAMLQAGMAELSQVNDTKVERLGRRARPIGVHFTKRPKLLVDRAAVVGRHGCILTDLGTDRRTVDCIPVRQRRRAVPRGVGIVGLLEMDLTGYLGVAARGPLL